MSIPFLKKSMVRGTISRAEVMGACVGFGEIEKNATLLTVELG